MHFGVEDLPRSRIPYIQRFSHTLHSLVPRLPTGGAREPQLSGATSGRCRTRLYPSLMKQRYSPLTPTKTSLSIKRDLLEVSRYSYNADRADLYKIHVTSPPLYIVTSCYTEGQTSLRQPPWKTTCSFGSWRPEVYLAEVWLSSRRADEDEKC